MCAANSARSEVDDNILVVHNAMMQIIYASDAFLAMLQYVDRH